MTEQLKKTIRDFIDSWNDTIDDDFMGLADFIYKYLENK